MNGRRRQRLAAGGMLLGLLAVSGCNTGVTSLGGGSEAGPVVTWQGYIENFQFRSGSDTAELTMEPHPGGALTGHIRFGTDVLPPVTNPDVFYPESGADAAAAPGFQPTDGWDVYLPYEGFDFTVLQPELTADRLRFAIDPREIWQSWCELQSPHPYPSAPSGFRCVYGASTANYTDGTCSQEDPITHMDVAMDCGRIYLCGSVCECTADACSYTSEPKIYFDLLVAGERADGSVAELRDEMHNVHLTILP